jgi:3-oxoacyl-[acyl-carrier-protein] synthase III
VLAELVAWTSLTEEFLDRWRTPGAPASRLWEERFGENRYAGLGTEALKLALGDAGLGPDDVSALIVAGLRGRAAGTVAARSGMPAARVADRLDARVGNVGTAQPALLLAAALEAAVAEGTWPGQVIVLVTLSDGADVAVFRTTGALRSFVPARTVAAQMAEGAPVSCATYLVWRGIKDRVAIIGMGCTRFAEHWDMGVDELLLAATGEAFGSAGVSKEDVDAYWLGTAQSGMSGLTLSRPLRLQGKPVTRVENYCATGSEALRQVAYAVASGAYDMAMAVGVEKVKDSGYQGLNAFPIPNDGTQRTLTAAAMFSMVAPAYAQRYAAVPLDPLTPVSHVAATVVAGAHGERIGSAADALRWRPHGAVLTSALQVGLAQGGLDLAVRYAKEHTQFDRLIGSFQAVKHLLAESLARVDLARAAVLVAALTIDDPQATGTAEAVSAAKILADDAATQGGRCCVQVHGGMGFTWEVLAHLYLKRAWLLETCFGLPDEHAARLAAALPD